MIDYELLRVIWWCLVGVLLIGFAVTDGFDLGVGALLTLIGKNDKERRVMINTVGPHWDGNQVWFITAGGAIFAAWPMIYATAFSGFYLALALTLIALWMRPIGFDYRSKLPNPQWRKAWDWALFAGGIIPGILVGLGLMTVTHAMADKYDYPAAKRIVLDDVVISPAENILSRLLTRILLAVVVWKLLPEALTLAVAGPESGLAGTTMAAVISLAITEGVLWLLRKVMTAPFRTVSKRAVLPLLTPLIILGGILGGVFTPTEASAVAVAYALLLGLVVLRTLDLSDLPAILTKSAITSAVVLLLVGAAMAFKTVVSLSYAAESLAAWILTLTSDPLFLLLLINILLFIVGMFLDAGPAIIILGPILAPIFISLGIHPVHFAMIMSVNLTVGLATPPMGLVLFVASSVSGVKVETISRAILPFLAVEGRAIMENPPLDMAAPRIKLA